jgi:tetratricopeptide (TPR) repeat protein
LATAALGFLVWKFRKERELIFGLAFFAITIALVIQLLPVGGTIVSERYSYVPYIGLLIPLAVWLDRAFQKKKNTIAVIVAVPALLFSIKSFDRVNYWENGDVLFTDVIEKYPKLPYAYNNRGFLYWDYYALKVYAENPLKKDSYVNKAYQDYTVAVSLDPNYKQAWNNRAVLLYNTGKIEESLADFNVVLAIDSLYSDGLIGRANTLSTLNKFEESLPDYNAYLQIKPEDTKAYVWRAIANANLKRFDLAFADLKFALQKDNTDYEAWYWTGICHYNLVNYDSAIYNFDQSIQRKQDFYEVYAWKALALHKLKRFDEALQVFAHAISMNPADPANYVNRAITLYNMNRYDEALKDLQTAGEMQYPLNREFFMAVQNKDPYLQE